MEILRLEEDDEPAFRKQSAFGIKLNTDGYGLSYEIGRASSARRMTLFQFEINEKKHPKEEKQSLQSASSAGFLFFGNPFVFGKKNIFYQVKLGGGQQVMIGGKGNKNGVAVYAIATGGFSAGFLRPYYVEVPGSNGNTQTEDIKYTQADSVRFLGTEIIGGTGLRKGWNELKFVPGLYIKPAIRFDYNRFNTLISALEVGFNFEYYFNEVEIMVNNPSKNLFANAYVSLLFGKRK